MAKQDATHASTATKNTWWSARTQMRRSYLEGIQQALENELDVGGSRVATLNSSLSADEPGPSLWVSVSDDLETDADDVREYMDGVGLTEIHNTADTFITFH